MNLVLVQVFFCLFGLALAASYDYNRYSPTLRQESYTNPDGSYSYLYETDNGIYEDRQGYVKAQDVFATQGQSQYVAPDGQLVRLSYVADENGYHPVGEHLPTPPPIPPAIQRALDYIARVNAQRNLYRNY